MFQEAERKIPINYASRYTSEAGGLQKSAYLPFKVSQAISDVNCACYILSCQVY